MNNLLRLGTRFLTLSAEKELPIHIICTTNSIGFDACDAVLARARTAGIIVATEECTFDGIRPISISACDEHCPEDYDDEMAVEEVVEMGFTLVRLPDFLLGSEDDDGTRCSDGTIPYRYYVVESLREGVTTFTLENT